MVWQQLIRRFIYQQAGAKVREAAAAAADPSQRPEPGSSKDADPTQVENQDCQVAIVYDGEGGAGSLLDRMQEVFTVSGDCFVAHRGRLAGRRVVVAVPEKTPSAAAQAARAMISAHHPEWLFCAGSADGLTSDLRRGDIVIAQHVANTMGHSPALDVESVLATPVAAGNVHLGRIVSLEERPGTPKLKRQLAERYAAIAADSDSFAVVSAVGDSTTRLLVVRVIRSTQDELPPPEMKVMDQQQTLAGKLGAATGALMRRPGSAKDWLKRQEQTLAVSDRLASFLEQLVPQLVPADPSQPTKKTSSE